MANIRKVDLMDIRPDKNVLPAKPDYYINRRGYYYNRGIYTYDLLLDGKYYGTVQVKIKDDRKALMVRAKKVFPLLRKVKKERITFLLFGECGERFVGDPAPKVKVRKTEKPLKDDSLHSKMNYLLNDTDTSSNSISYVTVDKHYHITPYNSIDDIRMELDATVSEINTCATTNSRLISRNAEQFRKVRKHYVFYLSDDYMEAIRKMQVADDMKEGRIVVIDSNLKDYHLYDGSLAAAEELMVTQKCIWQNARKNHENISKGLPLQPSRKDNLYICYASSRWHEAIDKMTEGLSKH